MRKDLTMSSNKTVWAKVAGEVDGKTKTPPRALMRAESAPRSLQRLSRNTETFTHDNHGNLRRTSSGLKEMVESLNDVPEQFVLPPHLQPGHTAKADPKAINLPLVDITGVNENPERRKQAVKDIYNACKEWGFFQVIDPLPILLPSLTSGFF
jgi:hypothetical protein